MIGSWNVNIDINGMPEKVATAFNSIDITGAAYKFIAYLGSQQVNGINHAVLAEQTILTGKDTTNIVIMIFNEKDMDCTLVDIERVVEGGPALGGLDINVLTDIPEEAMTALKSGLVGYVGARVHPFALLGTKTTKGISYLFAAELEPAYPVTESSVVIIVVNSMTNDMRIANILDSKLATALGYAFNW